MIFIDADISFREADVLNMMRQDRELLYVRIVR